jgi:Amt family ammonium transporter
MNEINAADTAWLLVSTALVLVMTPALALFYGGMVRSKNVLSTYMHSFFSMGIATVLWVVVGYSLAFGRSKGGLIGGLDHALLEGVGMEAREGQTVPHLLFMAFQLMFAMITPALISGAYAERVKFSAYVAFTSLWLLLVYSPVCHWVWAPGGWLFERGALDFAGGTVVHLTSGLSALVFAVVLGKRVGYPLRKWAPHNLTMTLIGAGLLWFGWFGFNAGSALTSSGLASLALVNTHVAAAAGALSWPAVEWIKHGKPSSLGVASGLVAGLVVITPAAGFVGPGAALILGLLAGVACFFGVQLKRKLGYDDALDAFGVHGVGGALGAILTGVVARKAWNPAGKDGLLFGGAGVLLEQLIAVAAAGAYAALVTFALLKLIEKTIGLRAAKDEEQEGLDAALHGEEGYALTEGGFGRALVSEGGGERESEGAKRLEAAEGV